MGSSAGIKFLIGAALVAGFALQAAQAIGQTLARPDWAGSGMTIQPWWKHAVFYEIDTRSFQDTNGDGVGDLKGITQHLDYIQSLGVEAILLEPLGGTGSTAAGGAGSAAIDPALGTLEDFDELSLQASRQNIRILLELPDPDPALARFWLNRGVAGFHVPAAAMAASSAKVQAVRGLLPRLLGDRVLVTDADLAAANDASAERKVSASPVSSPGKQSPRASELLLDGTLLRLPQGGGGLAAAMRAALEHSQPGARGGNRLLASDAQGLPRSFDRFAAGDSGGQAAKDGMAKIVAAVLLLNRSIPVIYAGQELGLSSPTGAAVAMPWGPPPVVAAPEPEPVAPPPPPPVAAAAPDKYTPYVPYVRPVAPPKPVPPDPASVVGQSSRADSLLSFYRQLSQLHRGNAAMREGDEASLNLDGAGANAAAASGGGLLVWARRPQNPSYERPAIVVLCNLSDKPRQVSLATDLAPLNLKGKFLRALLASDASLGLAEREPVIPPYGVFVGAVLY